jgi:hypothetical protein
MMGCRILFRDGRTPLGKCTRVCKNIRLYTEGYMVSSIVLHAVNDSIYWTIFALPGPSTGLLNYGSGVPLSTGWSCHPTYSRYSTSTTSAHHTHVHVNIYIYIPCACESYKIYIVISIYTIRIFIR